MAIRAPQWGAVFRGEKEGHGGNRALVRDQTLADFAVRSDSRRLRRSAASERRSESRGPQPRLELPRSCEGQHLTGPNNRSSSGHGLAPSGAPRRRYICDRGYPLRDDAGEVPQLFPTTQSSPGGESSIEAGYSYLAALYGMGVSVRSTYSLVMMSATPSMIAIVCSKCAESLPSAVTIVQLSSS